MIPNYSSFNYSITRIGFSQRPGLPGGLEFKLSIRWMFKKIVFLLKFWNILEENITHVAIDAATMLN